MQSRRYILTKYNSLYAGNVGSGFIRLSAFLTTVCPLQALKFPFKTIRTERPGRPYSVISYGTIEEPGESKLVVAKTYRKVNETTVEKVEQVG
jgi:hypothetical protein